MSGGSREKSRKRRNRINKLTKEGNLKSKYSEERGTAEVTIEEHSPPARRPRNAVLSPEKKKNRSRSSRKSQSKKSRRQQSIKSFNSSYKSNRSSRKSRNHSTKKKKSNRKYKRANESSKMKRPPSQILKPIRQKTGRSS